MACLAGSAAAGSKRKIPCKTPAIASSCYWTHGRLRMSNGNPSYRLWKIGTNRLLGIHSGPSADLYGLDNESPEFPSNVWQKLWVSIPKNSPWPNTIFADFEVCPLEPEKRGAMQAACIEAAKNIVVEK